MKKPKIKHYVQRINDAQIVGNPVYRVIELGWHGHTIRYTGPSRKEKPGDHKRLRR